MTRVRWIWELSAFSLVTLLVCYAMAPFRHPAALVLLLIAPLFLVFVLPRAMKTIYQECVALKSTFTWWHGLWFLLFASTLVFRMRTAQDINQSPIDAWALYRIGGTAIVGLVLCARLVSGKTPWLRGLLSGPIGIMVIYSVLSLVSTIWSVHPPWTFYKSVEYLVDLCTVTAIVVTMRSVQEYKKLANWTWTLLGLLVASAWVGAIIDPADGLLLGQNLGPITVRLEGLMPSVDANTIGEICAILALIALYRLLEDPDARYSRAWYGLLLSASLVTLLFSQTRAAVLAFFIGLAVLLIITRRYLFATIAGIASSLATVIVLVFTNFSRTLWELVLRGQTVQSAEGFSGRVELWQISFQKFLEHPWTGYGGFAGARFVVVPGLITENVTSDVLSTYFDSLLDLGIWGPTLLLIALIAAACCLVRFMRDRNFATADRRMAGEMLLVLCVVAVRSVVSGNIIYHPALSFFTVIGFAALARRRMKAAFVNTCGMKELCR